MGGNFVEILEGLVGVICVCFKLFWWVKVIIVEVKWLGMFLLMFFVVVLIFINLIKFDYYDGVKDVFEFIFVCIVVVVFLLMNMFVMCMLVNIKV